MLGSVLEMYGETNAVQRNKKRTTRPIGKKGVTDSFSFSLKDSTNFLYLPRHIEFNQKVTRGWRLVLAVPGKASRDASSLEMSKNECRTHERSSMY